MKKVFQDPDLYVAIFASDIILSSSFDIPEAGENETPFDPLSL